ncbi:MAG: patatin-like phospholipase family protein [Clostridia bacterium]|nr:patatin-like phospholipase family protein [Clostridia bacterium]
MERKNLKKTRKTLGFALGSGGARGVAHVGFLQAMNEAGLRPDFISGCSMGSVVGAAYASGMKASEMRRAVNSLRFFDLIDVTNKPGGFLDTRKMRKILARYIGELDFSELEIPFSCVALDMLSQKIVQFNEGSVVDAVVASSSIPAIFKPMEKDGMRLVDGGVLTRVPVKEVKDMGAEVVIAVDVMNGKPIREKCPSPMVMLADIIEIIDNERIAKYKKSNRKRYDLWLEPTLGDMNQYSFKNLDFAYEAGYELGTKNAEKIRQLIEG